jgi:NAD(P)-dependent dehydrogenase (short-subunit alcohol dehydrogenase family)
MLAADWAGQGDRPVTNIVIGAASGMGKAVAHKLAPRGPLLLADVNLEGVQAVARGIGSGVDAAACDLRDQAGIGRLLDRVSTVEALVLTAGISGSMGSAHDILDINLRGFERTIRSALPMITRGSVAVCFSSTGSYGMPEDQDILESLEDPLADDFFARYDALPFDTGAPFAYAYSKLGVRRLVRRWAPEFGKRSARIVSLSPGINDTPMNRVDEARAPIMAEIIKASPIGRRGTPDEVAQIVDFLTSPQASLMMGSDVLADGGMVAALPTQPYRRIEK